LDNKIDFLSAKFKIIVLGIDCKMETLFFTGLYVSRIGLDMSHKVK